MPLTGITLTCECHLDVCIAKVHLQKDQEDEDEALITCYSL